jgi:hypothetical protein
MSDFNSFLIVANFTRHIYNNETNKNQLELGWFSISHHFIVNKIERRKSYGKWFKIKSNKTKIYRQLKFDPTLKALGDNPEIILDWDGFIKLHDFDIDSNSKEIKCSIERANLFEIILANIKHPDQGLSAAFILGIISLLIGILSLFLSIK